MSNIKSPKCWWCGQIANSREHIFKKSDMKRVYGMPPYTKNSQPVMIHGSKVKKIQGPNSDNGKFEKRLCQNCNNSRSSTYDNAYEKFITNSKQFFEPILISKELDLLAIFGITWQKDFQDVYRYYIKHICCILAEAGTTVPTNLINYLDNTEELRDAILQFEVRPLNYIFAQSYNLINHEMLKAGNLTILHLSQNKSNGFISWITTDWLSVNYIVKKDVKTLRQSIQPKDGKLAINVVSTDINILTKINGLPILDQANYIEQYDRDLDPNTLLHFYNRIYQYNQSPNE